MTAAPATPDTYALHRVPAGSPSHAQVVLPRPERELAAGCVSSCRRGHDETQLPDSGSSVRTVVTWAER